MHHNVYHNEYYSNINNATPKVTPNNAFNTPGPFVGGKKEHCTQFVFWGDDNADNNKHGNNQYAPETLSGRNMDGEIDNTYVTVSHLIVFAVSGFNEKRYISVMCTLFSSFYKYLHYPSTYTIIYTSEYILT